MYADVQKTQEDKVESELGKLMHSEKESLQLILEQVQSAMAKFQGKEDDSNKKKISKLVKEYNAYKKSKLRVKKGKLFRKRFPFWTPNDESL